MTFIEVGYNYRLTDLQAAVGRCQLARLPRLLTERRQQVARYVERLRDVRGLTLPVEPPGRTTNWQSFALRVVDRDSAPLVAALQAQGIGARGGISCAHLQPAYAGRWHTPLPESERATRQTLMLPLFPGLTEDKQSRVVAGLVESLQP